MSEDKKETTTVRYDHGVDEIVCASCGLKVVDKSRCLLCGRWFVWAGKGER